MGSCMPSAAGCPTEGCQTGALPASGAAWACRPACEAAGAATCASDRPWLSAGANAPVGCEGLPCSWVLLAVLARNAPEAAAAAAAGGSALTAEAPGVAPAWARPWGGPSATLPLPCAGSMFQSHGGTGGGVRGVNWGGVGPKFNVRVFQWCYVPHGWEGPHPRRAAGRGRRPCSSGWITPSVSSSGNQVTNGAFRLQETRRANPLALMRCTLPRV